MNTFGIIALSILIGAFALTLILVSIGLILLFLRAHKLTSAYASQFEKSVADLRNLVASTNLELTARLNEISGEDLKKAAERIAILVRAMSKNVSDNERAALAMGAIYQRIFSQDEMAKNSLPPEAYGEPDPEGGKSVSQSDAAKRDASTLNDM